MKNRLAEHLTTWKLWYAIPGFFALMVSSLIPMVGSMLLGPDNKTASAVLVPVQFIAFAVLALGGIALFARRWPSAADLGLKKSLTWKQILLLIVVFAVSHFGFWLLTLGAPSDPGVAGRYFDEQNLGGPLLPAGFVLFASVVLAPVCEELLYRGAILRPIHDAIARRGRLDPGRLGRLCAAAPGRFAHRARGRRLHGHRHRVRAGLRTHRLDDRGHGLALAAELLRLRADPGPGPRGRACVADSVHPGVRVPGDRVLRGAGVAGGVSSGVIRGRRRRSGGCARRRRRVGDRP